MVEQTPPNRLRVLHTEEILTVLCCAAHRSVKLFRRAKISVKTIPRLYLC